MAGSTRHAPAPVHPRRIRARSSDELAPVFFFLWLASIVRVAFALFRHETFGFIPTMALVSIALLPVLLFSESNH
jgi:hypothetical protein